MEEHALKGEYISALRNGVLSYGDVPAMVGQRGAHTALVGRNSTAADGEAGASLLCTILDVRAK